MLRLSTLWAVLELAESDGTNPIATAALKRWEVASSPPRLFRASANFVYIVCHGDHTRYLRLTHGADATVGSVENEAALLQWLAAGGVPVARPISSLTGRLVESVDTEVGTFHAVLFEAARGRQRNLDDLDDHDLSRWGASLANVHMAGDGFAPTGHEFNPEDLLLSDAIRAARPDAVVTEAQSVREAMLSVAPQQGVADAAWLHGDFELDNLFWHSGGITAIDFGDFFRGPRFLDVALALRDLTPVDGREANGVQAFLDGYNTASPAHPIDPELVALGRRFCGSRDLLRARAGARSEPGRKLPRLAQGTRTEAVSTRGAVRGILAVITAPIPPPRPRQSARFTLSN